jgi:hypothetical protein
MKDPRWGRYNGILHLFNWWKPDKIHWRGLIDGKNHPVALCRREEPRSYHDVEWLPKGKLNGVDYPNDEVCVHCLVEIERDK